MNVRGDVLALAGLDIPALGAGSTPRRWAILQSWARRQDVSVARLAEAHVDAQQILSEAGLSNGTAGAMLYGVWASRSTADDLVFGRHGATINGTKQFCSGLGIIDRALVTVADENGYEWLVDAPVVPCATMKPDLGRWSTQALRDTATGAAVFEDHAIGRIVGDPGWYLDRPGFWHGAMGPAACWSGAACGLVDQAELSAGDDPHRLAALGAMRAEALTMTAVLDHTARRTDSDFDDTTSARYRAIASRASIERSCTRILDEFSRAWGPRPFTGDAATAQRHSDTHLYLRQQHGVRELAELGALDPAGEADGGR